MNPVFEYIKAQPINNIPELTAPMIKYFKQSRICLTNSLNRSPVQNAQQVHAYRLDKLIGQR